MFRLPRLLDPPVAPTAGLSASGRPSRLHHAELGWLPAPSSGIATCPSRATDTAGLSPAGLQPCRLLLVRGRRRRVRVTAVAKGPKVPVAGGGHMQSAIRHAVQSLDGAATAGRPRHKMSCRHCASPVGSRSPRQVSRALMRHAECTPCYVHSRMRRCHIRHKPPHPTASWPESPLPCPAALLLRRHRCLATLRMLCGTPGRTPTPSRSGQLVNAPVRPAPEPPASAGCACAMTPTTKWVESAGHPTASL